MQGTTESSFETAGGGFLPQPQQQWGRRHGGSEISPAEAAVQFFRDYARERHEVVAMWAFGVGFILGWKLKPW